MSITLDHPHDRLRIAMQAFANAENARLYGRNGGAETYDQVRAALSLSPMAVTQIAEMARVAPGTARRKVDAMVAEGVAVRSVLAGPTGGVAHLYALRAGVVA